MPEPLADKIPEFHPARESLTVIGIGALSIVPIVGGTAATLISGALSAQAGKRNADLFRQIVEVVDDLTQQVSGWTPTCQGWVRPGANSKSAV